jgi:hypothetical protein
MKLRPSQNFVNYDDGPFDPARLARDLRRVRQTVGGKPRGFCYACGDAWLRWSDEEMLREWDGVIPPLTYEVDLDKSKFVVIRSAQGMRRFQRAYGVAGTDDLDPDWIEIDWRAVARDHDGIQICPVQPDFRRGWYVGWDVASGCVWRRRAIRGVRRIDGGCAGPVTRRAGARCGPGSRGRSGR